MTGSGASCGSQEEKLPKVNEEVSCIMFFFLVFSSFASVISVSYSLLSVNKEVTVRCSFLFFVYQSSNHFYVST